MKWNQLYWIRSYARASLWIVPLIAMPLALLSSRLLHWIDPWVGWRILGLAVPGAQATLQTIVTATLSFVVFTFGSLLVAIQVASAQLTPRIIATTLLRNDIVRYTVGLFTFTLFFALSAQNKIETTVYQSVLVVASILGVCCFAAFFYLIDYASRLLRPISILTQVGSAGLAVIESVYPESSLGAGVAHDRRRARGASDRVLAHQGTSGIVLAVNIATIFAEAKRSDTVVEFVPQVGDFVAIDEPLFKLYGGGRPVDEQVLRAAVALGSERTMEQDPTFAFRIVIDIALRALSPAINDPTTAVLAMDQLHRMLRMVGKRHLRTDELLDDNGQLRLIFRTPDWEDFVHLAFSEIRSCGANNLQVVRRLRSMIDNLIETLPEHRHPSLLQELQLLDQYVERNFGYPAELLLARVADSQGLGGRSGLKLQ